VTPTRWWRFLVLAVGVTGLSLGWVSNAGPLGPLVFFTDQSNIAVAAYMAFLLHYVIPPTVLRPGRRQGRIPVGVTLTGFHACESGTNRNTGTAVLARA